MVDSLIKNVEKDMEERYFLGSKRRNGRFMSMVILIMGNILEVAGTA